MARIFDHLQDGSNNSQNVGFEPGRLGEYPAWFTKMDFQRRLAEEYYGQGRREFFLKYPLTYIFVWYGPIWTLGAVASFLFAWFMMIGFVFENAGVGSFFGVIFSLIMWAIWGYVFLWRFGAKVFLTAISLHLQYEGPASPVIYKACDAYDDVMNNFRTIKSEPR